MCDGALSRRGEKEESYFLRVLQTQSARAAGAGNGQREPFRPPGFLALEKRALSLLRPCALPTPHPTPHLLLFSSFFLSFSFVFTSFFFLILLFFFLSCFWKASARAEWGRGARVAASIRRSRRTGTVRTTFPREGLAGDAERDRRVSGAKQRL